MVDEGFLAAEGDAAGNDSDFETSLASIDAALEDFDRLHEVTAGLGDAFKLIREQLVRRQSARNHPGGTRTRRASDVR
jgi:hypothetical protein